MSHYETLGVPHDADVETIRASYRRLARACHPDLLGADAPEEETARAEARMSRLNEAWTVLGDPRSRAAYDRDLARGTGSPGGVHDAREGHPDQGTNPRGDGAPEADPVAGDAVETGEESGEPLVGVARLLVRAAPPWFVFSFIVLVVSAVMESTSLRALALFGLLVSLVMFMVAPLLVMGSSRRPPPDSRP